LWKQVFIVAQVARIFISGAVAQYCSTQGLIGSLDRSRQGISIVEWDVKRLACILFKDVVVRQSSLMKQGPVDHRTDIRIDDIATTGIIAKFPNGRMK